MLGAIAIVPSAPVLVPELAGTAADEVAEVRAAVIAAAAALPPRWVVVRGLGASHAVFGPDSVGTFAGYGVDLVVRLSPQAVATPADDLVAVVRAVRRLGARSGAASGARPGPGLLRPP